MPVYRETSRAVSAGCDIELDYQFMLYPPGQSFIDEDAYVNGTIGGTSAHMAWGATYTWSKFSQSGFSTWDWEIRLTLTANNGHGATNTVTFVVDSGTENILTQSVVRSGTVSGSWSGSGNVDILWNIAEAPDPTTLEYPTWPRETTLTWYEQSASGSTQVSTLTLGGTSCVATGTVGATKRTANYTFLATFDGSAQEGGSASSDLTLVKVNGIAPSYTSHTHSSNGQTASNWSVSLTSSPTQSNTVELYSDARLRASCEMRGVARAWNEPYPDELTWRITGFDPISPGYRDIAGTGSFGSSETYDRYDFDSTIITTVGGTSTKKTALNELTPQIYAVIQSGLSAVADDTAQTRVLMRGWRFNGWDLVSTNNRSIAGSGNDRTFSPWEGMSGYRYLDVQIKAQSGTNVAGTIELTDFHGATKTWNVTAANTTYATTTLDLCSPDSWSSGSLPQTDGKDDPYPRINTSNTTYAGNESVDSAYWGVTSCRRLRVASGSIDIGTTTLKFTNTDSTYVPSGKQHRVERITKAEVAEVGTTTTYYTRRFWQQDRDGRLEEEGDIWWQKTVGTGDPPVIAYSLNPLTIADLAGQINVSDNSIVRHPGWTATRSIIKPVGSTCTVSLPPLSDCYLNGDTGYATWLFGAGILAKANPTFGTDFVYGHQYPGLAPNTIITAQTLFDKINGDFPPDLNDPFDLDPNLTAGLILAGGTILRGIGHGAILDNAGDPGNTGTVYVKRTSDNSIRGQDATFTASGLYYTGSPFALGESNHYIEYDTSSIAVNPMRTSKRQRGWFRAVPVGGSAVCLANSQANEFARAFITSGDLYIGYSEFPVAQGWVDVDSGINCDYVFIAWQRYIETRALLIAYEASGIVYRRTTTNFGRTVSVPTTIFSSGAKPAMCLDDGGNEIYFCRKSTGALATKVYDPQGNVVIAETNIVASGVDNEPIGCEFRDGWIVVMYSASGTLITRKSQNMTTYS